MRVKKNGNWLTVKAGSYAVVAAIDPKRFLYCEVTERDGDRLQVTSYTLAEQNDCSVEATTILFEISKHQFEFAKKLKYPQSSETVMKIVRWGKGGTS